MARSSRLLCGRGFLWSHMVSSPNRTQLSMTASSPCGGVSAVQATFPSVLPTHFQNSKSPNSFWRFLSLSIPVVFPLMALWPVHLPPPPVLNHCSVMQVVTLGPCFLVPLLYPAGGQVHLPQAEDVTFLDCICRLLLVALVTIQLVSSLSSISFQTKEHAKTEKRPPLL